MLDFFADRLLPGEDPWRPFIASDTDVASFSDLWLAADMLETCCLQRKRNPGWVAAGRFCFPLASTSVIVD